jgi:hypothetical protein
MKHTLYPSIDAMLAPEALSALEGQPITDVRWLPFQPTSFSASGSRFLTLETNAGQGPRYVLKRISLEWDWIMRATDDRHGRSAAIWQCGLLDSLPPEIAQAIIACSVDGPGWAILMRDVSATLLPSEDQPISTIDSEQILDAMAALHATFWEAPLLADPALGLCSLQHFYTSLSPQMGRREAGGPDNAPQMILEAWELLETLVAPDVADLICGLHANPQPLCDALARYPQTLVHGDIRLANLGLLHGERPQVILLDWQFAMSGPPAADLAWYLGDTSENLPMSNEAVIAGYQQRLAHRLGARFDDQWWQPQLELCLLGNFMRTGWDIIDRITRGEVESKREYWRGELEWWSKQARAGARWL